VDALSLSSRRGICHGCLVVVVAIFVMLVWSCYRHSRRRRRVALAFATGVVMSTSSSCWRRRVAVVVAVSPWICYRCFGIDVFVVVVWTCCRCRRLTMALTMGVSSPSPFSLWWRCLLPLSFRLGICYGRFDVDVFVVDTLPLLLLSFL